MENVEVVVGLNGAENLFHLGYKYSKRRGPTIVPGSRHVTWMCSHSRKFSCKGSLKTTLPPYSNPIAVREHSHPADPAEVEVLQMRLKMRQRAADNRVAPVDAIATTLHDATDQAKMAVGNISTIKRDIRRVRTKKYPPQPKSVSEWEIPEEWQSTGGASAKQFLIHDSGMENSTRLVVFATEDQLRFLSKCQQWFMDGTFKMSSKLFQQVYIIRGQNEDQVRTCVYALMTNKTCEMYKELLRVVLAKSVALGQLPRPTCVMLDFEEGAMSAIKTVLGDEVAIKGCFFHLCQSTWRHIQSLGLVKKYNNDEETKLYCRMLDALAFLPTEQVQRGMEYLWGAAPFELFELLHYFDATYVSGVTGNSPKPPLFPPEVWNVHSATVAGLSRTNNHCEGWNSRFNSMIGHPNPSVWTILETFQKDEALERAYLMGVPADGRKRKQQEKYQQRLKTLCEEFTSGGRQMESFLSRIAQTIKLG